MNRAIEGHELIVVPTEDDKGKPGFKPRCSCGWVANSWTYPTPKGAFEVALDHWGKIMERSGSTSGRWAFVEMTR